MRNASPLFGSGAPALGPVTKGLLGLFIGLSIICKLGPAAGVNLAEWLVLEPTSVLHGEVWRLVTYPWLSGTPLSLIFGALTLYLFGAQLEETWGPQRYMKRLVWFVLAPAIVTVALSLFLTSVRQGQYLGVESIILMIVVAYASQMRGRTMYMFPIPVPLSGDGFIWLEAAFLGLYIVFARSVAPFMVDVVAFGLALGWFRFDLGRDVRRSWLRIKKRRIEAQMARARAARNLRVVSSDDEDPPGFVH